MATALVNLATVYVLVGMVFAIAFVLVGVKKVDPAAAGSSRGFRLIILPGAIALWPLLARRWFMKQPPPAERNPHRDAARSA